MIALLQRVQHALVVVNATTIAQINQGVLVFIGIEKTDTPQQADRMLKKILAYRIFADQEDKMNLCVKDIQGGILLVPQFTLAADTHKGNRPSFSNSQPPKEAKILYHYLLTQAQHQYPWVKSGQFAANMQVSLCNDGPVTFIIQI